MGWGRLFLSPQGRIGQREFWIGCAIVMVPGLLLNLTILGPMFGFLLSLLLLWPQICISGKRLHDMGRTSWLLLAPLAVICASLFLTVLATAWGLHENDPSAAGGMAVIALGVRWLTGLAFIIWIGLSPGQVEANRFGEAPPKA